MATAAIIAAGCFTTVNGQQQCRFANEAADTARLTSMLIELEAQKRQQEEHGERADVGKFVADAGRKFLGTPYVGGTLEGEPEMLTVNTEGLDCTTLVETAMAIAMTIDSNRSSWRDFIWNLTQLRYRGGSVDGYGSRLHYISDWIVDNSHRGLLTEVTDRIGRADYAVKTLDFMSSHSDKYAALKDSASLAGIKRAEMGYRNHRFPYIKPQNLKGVDLREGDIIAITTNIKGLDVSHLGIIVVEDGQPRLLHASSRAGKVVIEKSALPEYFRKNRSATGIRVIRLVRQ